MSIILNNYYPFINTPLPYPYNALEPYIDTKTMELHHDKHLQTYIDNLNSALAQYPVIQKLSLEELILASSELPTSIRNQVHNNAGG
ncbi:MAG: superoxide dismutase, partial [Angelakisella sp.]